MPPRLIARQLAQPSGVLGRFVGGLMNLHNAGMNAFALELLAARPADRVLEIGFGGGVALARLVGEAAFVAGLERSHDAVEWARRRHAQAVRAALAVRGFEDVRLERAPGGARWQVAVARLE